MATDDNNTVAEELNDAADKAARTVKRGARRVARAVDEGVDAVDDALRPGFGAQLADIVRSIVDDPESTPGLTRDIVRDHPIASLFTAAAVGVGAARLLRRRR
jgi:ElaB/YqjD/DUF883 family membrane-anchored ribosome-binding protein